MCCWSENGFIWSNHKEELRADFVTLFIVDFVTLFIVNFLTFFVVDFVILFLVDFVTLFVVNLVTRFVVGLISAFVVGLVPVFLVGLVPIFDVILSGMKLTMISSIHCLNELSLTKIPDGAVETNNSSEAVPMRTM